jgi:DNA-binding transcriptional LysR family regulator
MALLENIRVFVRVVEFGSLSAAGRHMRLSPAVVSHRLQQLESHLGTHLLNRTTRQVSRPSPGWSATGRSILAPLVPEFQARHPQVDLRLRQAMRRPRPSSTRT